MEQTSYILKPESWNHYDPIFNEHRTLYKKDIQEVRLVLLRHYTELYSQFIVLNKYLCLYKI